jgi:hypothetical protein
MRSKGTVRSRQPIAAPRFSLSASNAVITCSAVIPISPPSKRSMKQVPPNKRFGQDSRTSCQIKGLATFIVKVTTSLRSGSSSLGMRAWSSLIVNPLWSSLARVAQSYRGPHGPPSLFSQILSILKVPRWRMVRGFDPPCPKQAKNCGPLWSRKRLANAADGTSGKRQCTKSLRDSPLTPGGKARH